MKKSPDTCQYLSWTMHPLVNTSEALVNSAYTKHSPTLSLGSKHPFLNIFRKKIFTPNQPYLSLDTYQYLLWSMHALVHTFKALIKCVDVKKKQCPTLSLGSKHPFPNILHENFSTPNQPNLSQTHTTTYHEVCMHLSTLSKLSSNLQMQKNKVHRE